MPQPPQLAESFRGSVHAPLQVWKLRPHSQLALTHVSPRSQTVPQLPQLAGSVRICTQAPSHTLSPRAQLLVHAPRLQN